jgi:outer membrane lipoprotein-sorting protein
MGIKKIVLNERLEAERFTLTPPAGAEVVHVGDVSKGNTP